MTNKYLNFLTNLLEHSQDSLEESKGSDPRSSQDEMFEFESEPSLDGFEIYVNGRLAGETADRIFKFMKKNYSGYPSKDIISKIVDRISRARGGMVSAKWDKSNSTWDLYHNTLGKIK